MHTKDFSSYANSFQATARLKLESITLLLDFLSHPERELKFIHVAGTNGKGSVCAFLQEIFTAAGYRCGKYTSPNLISVCERISIDNSEITESELEKIMDTVKIASQKVFEHIGDFPTQFEIWTAAAFCYFKQKKCDIVILETGLGGVRDATNVIPAPLASVICRIAMDHTEYLGNNLSEIASQKAGIIKKHSDGKIGITVTLPQADEVCNTLNKACTECNNKLIFADTPKVHSPNGMYEVFDYKNITGLMSGIAGYHQLENASLAIETALQLGIDENAIKTGIKKAKNRGRFEQVDKNIIFDGAHNPNGMHALVSGLKRYFPNITPNFVMGFMADKDISSAVSYIKESYPDTKIFTVTVCDNPRAETAEKLSEILNTCGLNATACKDIDSAICASQSSAPLTVICGSLYLYKDFANSKKNRFETN